MGGHSVFDVLIVAVPATIAAAAAVYGARLAQGARTAATTSAAKADQTQDRLDTGNGKDIGTTVHDIAQTVEAIQAQSHANAGDIRAVRDQLMLWKAESRAVHDRMQRHLEEGNGNDGTE